jgi:beta-lactamase class A
MEKHKNTFFIVISIIILSAGVVIGRFAWSVSNVTIVPIQIRDNSQRYKFISPLLLVSNSGAGKSPEYKTITNTLTDYVNKIISQKKAMDVSIYFRDLNSGLYSGVNENHLYSPASMMKVAVLIECFKLEETNPSFFAKSISMNPNSENFNVDQFYLPQNPIVSGKAYTVSELMDHMVVDSDNNATALLEYLIGDAKISGLLKELQLPDLNSKSEDFMSPQLYSRLYRILYNSTYLSPDVSEKTLDLLTKKSFSQGIISGVPSNIDVAQKFGERTQNDQLGNVVSRELHDCGIIYLPKNPYFLCVMTKGQNFAELQPIISDVSKMVWDYFSKVNNN